MYIIKNAFKNLIKGKGKNILIGIIIMIVTISGCIALSINKSSKSLKTSYLESNPLEVGFTLDMGSLRGAESDTLTSFSTIDIDLVKEIADSDYVSDYYYYYQLSMSSDDIEAVDITEMEIPDNGNGNSSGKQPNKKFDMSSMGEVSLTSYSDFSYLKEFIEGTKKISEGVMIDNESDEYQAVISSDLASENSLEIGDTFTLYSPKDEDKTYKFTIVGIYEDTSEIESSGFMSMTMTSSRNNIYTNLTTMEEVIENLPEEDTSSTSIKMVASNGLTAKFYLNNNDDLDAFTAEAHEKGLSSYYTSSTNESEITASLAPIENVSQYAKTFLIVILVIGAIILSVINVINIQNRKYEIGVLRAIGMSKIKVNMQLVLELLMVAMISVTIGTVSGTLLSQPLTNYMLKNEIDSYKEEQTTISENFGGGNFNHGGMDQNKGMNRFVNPTSYIDSLSVSTDVTTVLLLVVISLGLTSLSSFIAVMYVNQYEPNKILQNRS